MVHVQCRTTTAVELISHIAPLSPITPWLALRMVSNEFVLCVLSTEAAAKGLSKILIALVGESLCRIIHRVFPRADSI